MAAVVKEKGQGNKERFLLPFLIFFLFRVLGRTWYTEILGLHQYFTVDGVLENSLSLL